MEKPLCVIGLTLLYMGAYMHENREARGGEIPRHVSVVYIH